MKLKNILWIDRWTKYIWLAYMQENTEIIFPIWYILNDKMTYFNIADLIARYNIKTIVIWRPSKQKDIQEKIEKFMQSLNYFKYSNKILYLDGKFLNSIYKGIILVASFLDPNKKLCPLAISIVSIENIKNWKWFLSNIKIHLKK